ARSGAHTPAFRSCLYVLFYTLFNESVSLCLILRQCYPDFLAFGYKYCILFARGGVTRLVCVWWQTKCRPRVFQSCGRAHKPLEFWSPKKQVLHLSATCRELDFTPLPSTCLVLARYPGPRPTNPRRLLDGPRPGVGRSLGAHPQAP
ncbi:unnamed protein product, partial [Ectocarpus sp. 13 AM-2016]